MIKTFQIEKWILTLACLWMEQERTRDDDDTDVRPSCGQRAARRPRVTLRLSVTTWTLSVRYGGLVAFILLLFLARRYFFFLVCSRNPSKTSKWIEIISASPPLPLSLLLSLSVQTDVWSLMIGLYTRRVAVSCPAINAGRLSLPMSF